MLGVGHGHEISGFHEIFGLGMIPAVKSNIDSVIGRARGRGKRILITTIKDGTNKQVVTEMASEYNEMFERMFHKILFYLIVFGFVPYAMRKDSKLGEVPYIPSKDMVRIRFRRLKDVLSWTARMEPVSREVKIKGRVYIQEQPYVDKTIVNNKKVNLLVPGTGFYKLFELSQMKYEYWRLNNQFHRLNAYNNRNPITDQDVPSGLMSAGTYGNFTNLHKRMHAIVPLKDKQLQEYTDDQVRALIGVSQHSHLMQHHQLRDIAIKSDIKNVSNLSRVGINTFGPLAKPVFRPPLKEPQKEIDRIEVEINNFIHDMFGFSSSKKQAKVSINKDMEVDLLNNKLRHFMESLSNVLTVMWNDMRVKQLEVVKTKMINGLMSLPYEDFNALSKVKDNLSSSVRLQVQYTQFMNDEIEQLVFDMYNRQNDVDGLTKYIESRYDLRLPKVKKATNGGLEKKEVKQDEEVKESLQVTTPESGTEEVKDEEKVTSKNKKKRKREETEEERKEIENPEKRNKK